MRKLSALDGFNIDGAQKATGSDLISKFKATGTDNYDVGGDAYTVNVDSGAVKDKDNKDVFVSAADGSLTTSSDTKVDGKSIDATELAKLAINLADQKSIDYKGITFTNKSGIAFDANGKGVLTANIDGQDVKFTINSKAATGADATITTDIDVYKNSAGQFTTTKVENKAATLSDLDLNAAKKTGSTLVVNGATYNVSADGKTVTDTTPVPLK